jgi:hypothetical protein
MPGYLCFYQRTVRLRLRFNLTAAAGMPNLQALQANTALAQALQNSVLAGLGLYGTPGITAVFEGFSSDATVAAA